MSTGLVAALTVISLLGGALALAPPAAAAGSLLYVAGGGSNASNTCALSSSPCATISYALTQAAPGPIVIEVVGTINDHVTYSGAEPLTITGAHAPVGSPAVIDGTGTGTDLVLDSDVTIDNLTIENGVSPALSYGGGILSADVLTLNNVTVTGNSATYGGGGISTRGTLLVNHSTITGNTSGTCACGSYSGGGGISITSTQTYVTVTDSTIAGNTADTGAGGAIDNTYAGYTSAVTIVNSTLSGNRALDGDGGALAGSSFGVTNTTIQGNTASIGGAFYETAVAGEGSALTDDTVSGNSGPALYVSYSEVTLAGSIVANNAGGDCASVGGYGIVSFGYNIDDDDSCSLDTTGDVRDRPAALGALANNGGPTMTMLPIAGNPAIGAVPPGTSPGESTEICPRTDQRGATGPPTGQANCSMGAVEVGTYQSQSALAVTSVNGTYATPLSLSTSGGSGSGAVTFQATDGTATGCAVSSSAPYTLSSSSAGICTVTATKGSQGSYLPVSSPPTYVTLAVAPQPALSVATTTATYGTPLTLSTSGGGGSGAVTFHTTNGTATGCEISGARPYTLTASVTGTCTVTATKAGDGNYLPTTSPTATVTIGRATQAALVVTSVSGAEGTPIPLTTSGGSGTGAVTYVATNGTATGCSVTVSTPYALNATSLGTCIVTATKASDTDYLAISSAPTTVTLAHDTQSALTVTSLTGRYRTPLTLTTSGGSGTGAVTYVAANGTATGCSVSVATPYTLGSTSTGTCTVTATKATDGTYLPRSSPPTAVIITEATPPVLVVTSVSGTYGSPLPLRTSGGAGGGAVTYEVSSGTATACSVSGSTPYTLSAATAGTCTVTATKASDGNYLAGSSVPTTVSLAKAVQAPLVLTSVSGIYGTPLPLSATGGSGTGALTYQAGNGTAPDCAVSVSLPKTLSAAGPGTCVVTVTKATDVHYLSESVPTMVTLTQATPSVTLGSGTAYGVWASGLNYPDGLAVNAFGDVYVANENASNVIEYSPGGTVLRTVSAYYPTSVAVDPSGDLFIAEPLNEEVLEVTPVGAQIPYDLVGQWNSPQAVATDASGNLYVVNDGSGVLNELTPAGVETTVASDLDNPQSVAVDAAGNLYVADNGDGQVFEIAPDGTKTTLGAGFTDPVSVAVDAGGDVYVGDAGTNELIRIAPNGTQTVVGSGYTFVGGVAVDPLGHLYVSDYEGNVIDQISQAPRASDVSVGAVMVMWQPPAYRGTSAITTYKVTAVDATSTARGGQTCTYTVVTPETDTCTVTKLTSGDHYTFRVAAANAAGAGPSSAPTNAVTVASPPTVTSVSPNTGPVSGGTLITITGTGFSAGAVVVIGTGSGAIAATSVGVLSSTKIIARTGATTTTGKFNLYVTANGATSATAASAVFTYS